MKPVVSVIMPVYNGHDHLRQCLDSVINQTLKNIEIICVDDGSEDDSVIILKEYADKDPRVHVVRQKNGGAGSARNTGLKHAVGRYLSFLDSDDFFEPDMLEKAVEKIREDQADFVVFRCDQYMEDTGKFKKAAYTLKTANLPPYTPFSCRTITNNVFRAFVGWAWDKLYDADFVRRNKLKFQEQRTSNDMLFVFSAVVLAKRISYFEDVLAHQRRNNNDSLSNTREKSWFCFYDALTALRDFLVRIGRYEELEKDFVNYALHFSLWNLNTITGDTYHVLYNKLKEEWFEDLGITSHDREYFYDEKEYSQYQEIMQRSSEDYLIKISVVIPIHNAEKYIKQALHSILKQQNIGLEVICVDDCSTDDTLRILRRYAAKYPNVHILKNSTNLYAGASRNRGIEAARGNYIHFLDSDDYVVPDSYEKIYRIAMDNDLDFIKTTAAAFDDQNGKEVDNPRYAMKNLEHGYDEKLLDFHRSPTKFLTGMSLVPWNALYKRTFLLENNIRFNHLFCINDRSFFVETCVKGQRMMLTRHDIVRHRTNVSGSLVDKRAEHFDCQFESYKIMMKICDDNNVSENVRFRILDAEMYDLINWYRKILDKNAVTEQLKKDLHDFTVKYVDLSLFEKREADSQWLKYRELTGV
ncbi:MAG: glycosyltransferase family 2 protein [Blautia sp.]|nr:glycosyltransferase family 2 protein [Blautia sp.]